jgi:uncharacterized surface protein with fasciclin (FAS1) repeats
LGALLSATLVAGVMTPVAMAAAPAAVMAQSTASSATGLLPGGQFSKVWLGLQAETPTAKTVVSVEFDRADALANGLGFYILSEANLSAVSAGNSLQDNNIGSGSSNFFENGATNILGADFEANGNAVFTLVVYNDSAGDANFKINVTNGFLTDGSNQVTFPGQATAEAAATEAAPAATEVATEAAPVAATEAATTTVAVATATPAPATVAATTGPVEIRALEVAGELPEQYDQHFLGLESSIRDGEINLLLTFDPQDSTELARRLNFWVLDAAGFKAFTEGDNPGDLAVAAGNRGEFANERVASFKASGFGPYTVIVYNNSRVPATYKLTVDGGILIDESGQTLTAQQAAPAVGATGATTTTAATTTTPSTTVAEPAATTAPAATAGTGAAGQPGGSHTVVAGDTLATIARDVYGDFQLYEELCAFNNIADCNVIEIGDVIKLPTTAEIGSGATAPVATATTAAAATATATPEATEEAASETITDTATLTDTTAVTTTATTTTTTTSTTKPATGTAASGNIVKVAAGNADFAILTAALEAAGLDTSLAGAGPFTVFAPSDAAFDALLSGNGLTAEDLLKAQELGDILKYHVVSGEVLAEDITNGMTMTTLQGKQITFEVKNGEVRVNGALVTTADIAASNGVIHVINQVILPPAE